MLVVVADAERAEPQIPHHRLGRIDGGEAFTGDGGPVREPGGETGEGGLVPCRQPQGAGERAYLRLREAGLQKGGTNAVACAGCHPRTEVAEVIDDGSVGDPPESFTVGNPPELPEQFGLAGKAAVGRVLAELGDIGFFGLDDADPGAEGFRRCERLLEFPRRVGCRPSDDGEGVRAERLHGDGEQEGAVDPSRVADRHPLHCSEDAPQLLVLSLQRFGQHGVSWKGTKK